MCACGVCARVCVCGACVCVCMHFTSPNPLFLHGTAPPSPGQSWPLSPHLPVTGFSFSLVSPCCPLSSRSGSLLVTPQNVYIKKRHESSLLAPESWSDKQQISKALAFNLFPLRKTSGTSLHHPPPPPPPPLPP